MDQNNKLILVVKKSSNEQKSYLIKPDEINEQESQTDSDNEKEFFHDEIEKYDAKNHILKDVNIMINHSIPFPIALVEDLTNIVATKALLLLHLFRSYASPCIICVLCKRFFNIGDFTKHFHVTNEDLSSSPSSSSSDEQGNEKLSSKISTETRKLRKIDDLRKKSFKILPYSIHGNNSNLDVNQIRVWKLFSERFAYFKEQKQELELRRRRFNDWDSANYEENFFIIAKKRLDADPLVLINHGSSLTSKVPTQKAKKTRQYFTLKLKNKNKGFNSLAKRMIQNYYENLSPSIREYILKNEFTIMPQDLLDFNMIENLKRKFLYNNYYSKVIENFDLEISNKLCK